MESEYNNFADWNHYFLARVYYERNDLESAVNHLAQAVDRRHLLQQRCAIDSIAGLVFTYQARQQPEEAKRQITLLFEFCLQTNIPGYVAIARSCQARLSLLQDDLASATSWVHTADLSTDVGPMFVWLEIPRLTECRVLIARGSAGDLQTATGKLQAYLQNAEDNHNTLKIIEILLLQDLAHQALSNIEVALTTLERAVSLARPGGSVRAFVEGVTPMAELLAGLLERDVTDGYVRKLLDAFPTLKSESNSQYPPQSQLEPLTRRELQTLRQLATDKSFAEIAADMVLSINTVRTHAKRIYGKLDVNSRTKAVHRANELGLL